MRKIKNPLLRFFAFVVGAVFVFSGILKANDAVGTVIKFNEYFDAFALAKNQIVINVLAFLVIFAEFMLGVFLILGFYKQNALRLVSFFVLFFTGLTFVIALTDRVKDCGCFGDFIALSNWETFSKNLVLCVLVAILWIGNYARSGMYFGIFIPRIVAIGSGAFLLIFTYYTYTNLPVWDFRPFAVGVNLNQKIDEGQDAEVVSFLYEKNGELEEFSIDNLPDSTWIWKETLTTANSADSEYDNLSFLTPYGDEFVDELMELDFAGLVFVSEGSGVSRSQIDAIEQFALDVENNDGMVFLVTYGVVEELVQWGISNGLDYDVLYADLKLVKTIIRANPGFVELRNGEIVAKSAVK